MLFHPILLSITSDITRECIVLYLKATTQEATSNSLHELCYGHSLKNRVTTRHIKAYRDPSRLFIFNFYAINLVLVFLSAKRMSK